MSISPGELAAEIARHVPGFSIDYQVDPVRQAIADSWPRAVDTQAAREDWGFTPKFDLGGMTKDMLAQLRARMAAHKAG
jgi:nucleoside-diphosphate-sugar epimerase